MGQKHEPSMSSLSANYFLVRMGTGGLPVLGWRLGWCLIDTILIVMGIGVDVGGDAYMQKIVTSNRKQTPSRKKQGFLRRSTDAPASTIVPVDDPIIV